MLEQQNRLRELRQRNRLTQETLAYLAGVSKKAYIAWELGRAVPRAENAKVLARRLRVNLDELGLRTR